MQQLRDKIYILYINRAIQPQLLANELHSSLSGILSGHDLRRISWDQAHGEKDQQRQDKQGGNYHQKPLQ